MFWLLWAKGNTWEKTHFNILGSTSCDSNFQFGCWPKSTNHIILVSARLISNMKIDMTISRSREFMMKNPFWDFECYTSENPCDFRGLKSSPWPRRNFGNMDFHFFHQTLPIYFKSRSRFVGLFRADPGSYCTSHQQNPITSALSTSNCATAWSLTWGGYGGHADSSVHTCWDWELLLGLPQLIWIIHLQATVTKVRTATSSVEVSRLTSHSLSLRSSTTLVVTHRR